MPLYYLKQFTQVSKLGVWEITESMDELTKAYGRSEDDFLNNMKSGKRKCEYLATRLLVQSMVKDDLPFVEIIKDEFGKPFLKNSAQHISVSHTGNFAAAIVHDSYWVGLDIEMVTPRIKKLSSRFLGNEEKKWLKKKSMNEQLHIIWGAKECAFKIFSKGGIDFKEMLEVSEFDYSKSGRTFVSLRKNKITNEYPVFWENIDGLMLVYGIANDLTLFKN